MDLLNKITIEHVKTLAATIQAVGVFIAAFLAYKLTKKLEEHKYDMRLKEIMHANTHKRRLETLENISALMGKLLFEMRDIAPNLNNSGKPPIEKIESENREDDLQRYFADRKKAFDAVCLELFHTCESGSIYLPDELQERLEGFRINVIRVIDAYCPGMLEPRKRSDAYRQLDEDFVEGWNRMRMERKEIVSSMQKKIIS